jgi:hypothetical protein
MEKMRKFRKKLVILLLILSFSIFMYGLNQNNNVNKLLDEFINRSLEEQTVTVQFENGIEEIRMYHPVERTKDYELFDQRSVFYTTQDEPYLGQKGDIFVTQESPFPNIFGVHQVMSFFVGGHAALNNGNNQFIEAVGFPQSDERIIDIIRDPSDGTHDFSVGVRQSSTNYWMLPNFRNNTDVSYSYYGSYYREKFIILRVKNIDEVILDHTMDYANNHLLNRSLYNFLFIADTHNKFYCTDFISRSYRYGINPSAKDKNYPKTLNDNGFVTTVNDLILSKETYIAAYVENRDGIRHIYYLEEAVLT